MTAYLRACPGCGGGLTPVALGPDSAPWLCATCSHGWFCCELAGPARAVFRPQHRDWGHAGGRELKRTRDLELAEAHARGTSALPEHLPLLSVAQLTTLAPRARMSAEFKALVEAEIARREATS